MTTKSLGAHSETTYYLPSWLIIGTLAVPYIYVWCRGVMATYYLYTYKNRVRGHVYKKALDYLAKGIAAIIFFSILTQIITVLSARLNRLDLTPILLILYVLVALYAVGFGYVARGAKKLKQIEEV